MSQEWPPFCPRCGSDEVEYEIQLEYTGGGYADRWYECICLECDYQWRTDNESGYS